MQVSAQLAGLGSHRSVVEDSEAAPRPKQEQMHVPQVGPMQEQWSAEHSSGFPLGSAMVHPQQPRSPTNDPHPFLQAADYMHVQSNSYDNVPVHPSYHSGQARLTLS